MNSVNGPEQQGAMNQLPGVLAKAPTLLRKYTDFLSSFKADGLVPERILEMCHLRIAWIHGLPLRGRGQDLGTHLDEALVEKLVSGDVSGFSAVEKAALALAEKIPFAHHQIEDAEVAAVSLHLKPSGCVSLLTALAFYDVNCRLTLACEGGKS